jgi:hypothetical protein
MIVRSLVNMMHRGRRGEGGVGHAVVGETHERAYVGLLPPTCAQPNEGQVALDHNLLKLGTYSYELKTFWNKYRWTPFQCTSNSLTLDLKHISKLSVIYSVFRNIPTKLSPSAKQDPSNLAHLTKQFVRGLSIYAY